MRISFSIFLMVWFSCLTFAQKQTGKSSFYHHGLKGHPTASGEKFNPNDFTAAHKHLPFGTKVLVTNLSNKKSIIVRINDRGPFVGDRIIDLSPAAAKKLGFYNHGITRVSLRAIHPKVEISGNLVIDSIVPKRNNAVQTKTSEIELLDSSFRRAPKYLLRTIL